LTVRYIFRGDGEQFGHPGNYWPKFCPWGELLTGELGAQNLVELTQLPLMILSQETRWAYSTTLPSPHGAYTTWHPHNGWVHCWAVATYIHATSPYRESPPIKQWQMVWIHRHMLHLL